MVKVSWNNIIIGSYFTKMEALVQYEDDPEVEIEEFCDICETNKPEENSTVCVDCCRGLSVDLFA